MTKTVDDQAATFLLGGTLKINRMGFGAMRITGHNIWGDPPNRQEARALLRRVIDWGINFIDTADSYGPEVSENILAETLHPYPKGLIIATKGGLVRPSPDRWEPLGRPEYLMQCVEMSLRRLRIDCIDLYQLHAIDPTVPLEESVGALKEMQIQGKIRFIGLSNVSVSEIKRAKKIVDIVSVQNQYNINYRVSEDVVGYCTQNKLAFIPWYPIGSGRLAHAGGPLQEIAKKKGITTSQLCLAWLLHHSNVMIPIPGTSTIKHLEENVAAASITLTQPELSILK
jgi:pyridoxine 4-dehydrogenase